ncbi:ABC transporter with duplicated ATPase domains [Beauveria bassiana ARSEF 2860]|uniref:ABC transporter with duplicated ATPase domains n=1 Tax=Beauveria bassiana (strain ARSEF 2860) TaxID=655819 RepID=J5JV57_BEAB2|nr:ABC transporter with duplicated ATPase domains [Beauveria bassiana ARSEF 2860]EJP66331.1 ABC transporter with duplicated ATPase domains [Beauveria bassiana ARSEF 2860]
MDLSRAADCFLLIVAPLLVILLFLRILYSRWAKTATSVTPVCNTEHSQAKKATPDTTQHKSTERYRRMFFQLQNLEDYPEVLEPARQELLAMFSHALSVALTEEPAYRNSSSSSSNSSSSILSLETYSAEAMSLFLRDAHERTLSGWSDYLERRKQGQGPELFASAEQAKDWLVQQAPVKFVDGAWLGHVHKTTTPFAFRSVTKHAWQVLSEELGDGDPDKHHVTLYRKLLESIGRPLPSGHSADFVQAGEWKRACENHGIWESAVAQLAISLFPNEFLPEILGFNMHYEQVRLDTMQVAHELAHYGIDPYYFLIHISIDNADSGHTAMASHAVVQYLDILRAMEGEAAVRQAWKRIQVGHVLSQTLGCYPCSSTARLGPESVQVLPSALGTQVLGIFRTKASVSRGIHYRSRARIGPYALHEWLEETMRVEANELDLLRALSRAKPWVVAGDSKKSLLVRELSWGGRMFGAFTKNEVTTICQWVDALKPESDSLLYWEFTQRQPVTSREAVAELQDPASHHPYVSAGSATSILNAFNSYMTPQDFDISAWDALTKHPCLNAISCNRLPDIIALWFAHISLLENTINTPSRTADPVHLSILRLLRAQAGFGIESDIVAGMDEVRRDFCTSLVDIGLELTQKLSRIAVSAKPRNLKQVLLLVASHGQGQESFRIANDMLQWSARPSANLGFLLGLALAFVEFKHAVGGDPKLLGPKSRLLLEAIVTREKRCLEECARELQRTDDALYKDLLRGNYLAISILPNCI